MTRFHPGFFPLGFDDAEGRRETDRKVTLAMIDKGIGMLAQGSSKKEAATWMAKECGCNVRTAEKHLEARGAKNERPDTEWLASEVLSCARAGLTAREAADRMGVSIKTVNSYARKMGTRLKSNKRGGL